MANYAWRETYEFEAPGGEEEILALLRTATDFAGNEVDVAIATIERMPRAVYDGTNWFEVQVLFRNHDDELQYYELRDVITEGLFLGHIQSAYEYLVFKGDRNTGHASEAILVNTEVVALFEA